MSIFNPIKNRLEKIEADLNAARPDQAPDFDEQTDAYRPVCLTMQQKEGWAETISRSLAPQTVRRYLDLLGRRRLTVLPPLAKRQKRRLEAQMIVLAIAEDKMNRGE